MTHAQEWVAAGCKAKQVAVDQPLAGEEWASITVTARYIRLLARGADRHRRRPQAAVPRQAAPGDRRPHRDPGVPVRRLRQGRASGFTGRGLAASRRRRRAGRRGPGQALVRRRRARRLARARRRQPGSIPIVDALDRLFVARHPVILKMNPVNDYLGPIFAKICAELIDRGVLRIVYGGAEVGTHLVRHDGVADVHVTGSDKTFEAIVFGGGEDGARRKAALDPLVTKPVTGRARQRLAGDRRTWPLVGQRPLVPGAEHRVDADQQRRVQLHRVARDHHREQLGPARRAARGRPRRAEGVRRPLPLLPGRPRPLRPLRRGAPGGRAVRRRRSRAACRGR